jgi:hypothetical protein
MKLLLSLFLAISIASLSFAQSKEQQVQQAKLLQAAYNAKSREKLDTFFGNWSRETPTLSDAAIEKLSDTIRNAYRVFEQFYNPLNIQRSGGSEWGNSIYKGVKYLVLQNEISIGFVDTLDGDLLLRQAAEKNPGDDRIKDSLIKKYWTNNERMRELYIDWPRAKVYGKVPYFCPKLSFSYPKAVIMTGFYDQLLNAFLGNTHLPLGAGSIMAPARSKGESQKRQQFLENCIKIFYGHWGGYWQMYSYPVVSTITFDKAFNNALIEFRMVYEGGEAYLRKVNGTWTLIGAQRTWIE